MLHNLRTVALLMLVAGLSLGVFASTLMANKRPARATLDEKIEERVKLYQEFHGLDAQRTGAIRRVLHQQRRALRDLIMDLRQRHQAEFTKLTKTTEERIQAILEGAR